MAKFIYAKIIFIGEDTMIQTDLRLVMLSAKAIIFREIADENLSDEIIFHSKMNINRANEKNEPDLQILFYS